MADRPRIFFVHINPDRVSFVQKDLDILSRHFELRELVYRSRRDVPRIAGGTMWADVVFSWFAWDQAAWATRFARMIRRKSVVLVGGFDVVKMPDISYGNLLRPRPAARTKYAISRAHRVVAVSDSLRSDAEKLTGRTDIKVIYPGFDSEAFRPLGEKKRVALTVGGVNRSNMSRKGIETFIKSASLLPEIPFRLVGGIDFGLQNELERICPSNLTLVGRVDQQTLLREMQNSSVYVQVSAHEGFGCSLAEAMLCCNVPVVTKAGAVQEVVGDTGIYVPFRDPQATAAAIETAFGLENGGAARRRIIDLFPLEKRERELVAVFHEILENGGSSGF